MQVVTRANRERPIQNERERWANVCRSLTPWPANVRGGPRLLLLAGRGAPGAAHRVHQRREPAARTWRRRDDAQRAPCGPPSGAGRGRHARQLLHGKPVDRTLRRRFPDCWSAVETARGLAAMLATSFPSPRIDRFTPTRGSSLRLVLSLATGMVFGVVPALSVGLARFDRCDARDRAAATGAAPRACAAASVILETALALVLLWRLTSCSRRSQRCATPPGFQAGSSPGRRPLAAPAAICLAARSRALLRRCASAGCARAPGVRSAAFVADLPLNGGSDGLGFHIVGRPDPTPGRPLDRRIQRGQRRLFPDDGDCGGGPDGISRTRTAVARQESSSSTKPLRSDSGPIQSPVRTADLVPRGDQGADSGPRRATATDRDATLLTVVGVTGDVRHQGLAIPPRPEIFVNALQSELTWPWSVLAVRTVADPGVAVRHSESARD